MKRLNKDNNIFKKITALLIIVFSVVFLSSCTKSFCTNQDSSNRLYASYGNIYEVDVEATDSSVISSNETKKGLEEQIQNRKALYSFVTQGTPVGRVSGYHYPMPDRRFNEYMNNKVNDFVNNNYVLWTNGKLDSLSVNDAKKVCTHVAIYAGIEDGMVSSLYRNMDIWYKDAINDIGYELVPASGYITAVQSFLNISVNSSTACISPISKEYGMSNSIIYIQGKTWGQAFKEYGFFEGLFVWPFAGLVHVISSGFGNNGWAQILAIFVVTMLVRSLTIISTIMQSKSQERSQLIQPELAALKNKYPNADNDKQQRQALAMEQMQLMRKAKTHPLRPFLFMILQFPLFICVWSALQGSASLASGRWLGISLTTTVQQCFSNYANTQGALTGLIVFFITCALSIGSNLSNLSFNKWKQDKGIIAAPATTGNGMDPSGTTKIMSYVFIAFYIIMSYRLPVGMNIYFYLGSVITLVQTIIMESLAAKKRRDKKNNTGDGSDLASLRRSSKHRLEDKNKKKQKALWR